MRRPPRTPLSWLLLPAILAVVPSLACRRVTIVSFEPESTSDMMVASRVNSVIVQTPENPQKAAMSLKSLGDTIGFYDLPGNTIQIQTWACVEGQLTLTANQTWDIVSDHVHVRLHLWQGPAAPCPTQMDGVVSGTPPDAGAGGAVGAGGAAGTGEPMGTGGHMGILGAGGGAGSPADAGTDAAAGGASGAAGTTDAGDAVECGDDSHGPVCEPPSGDPTAADVVPPPSNSTACDSYCADMQTTCPDNYLSLDSCRRYCALVAWPAGTPGMATGNTLGCRNYYLGQAAAIPVNQRGGFCAVAAAEGGQGDCGSGCANFCQAWTTLCTPSPADAASCMATCGSAMGTAHSEPTCRFLLLEKAAADRRYCAYVKFGSCLSCG
jgi:hypothetical protein